MDKINKALKFIWSLVRGNLMLKIMALLFAVILWSYVLAETNPVRTRVMNDITVKYENMAELKAKGYAISADLSDILDKVNIRLEVRQSELKYLSDENVKASVDLSTINGPGIQPLKITAQTTYGRVLEVSPSTVEIYVDDHIQQAVPVNVDITGSVPAGFYADTPELSPNVITISGARVDVERVTNAVCHIDLSGLTESFNKSMDITLYDNEGNVVDNALFSDSFPSVIVRLDVLHKKTVKVDALSALYGIEDIAPGYEIVDVTCTPDTVDIAGDAASLSGISSIELVPYPINGAKDSIVALLDYIVPEGVRVLTTQKVQIFVNIRELSDTKTYSRIDLRTKNLAPGLSARLDTRSIDVTVLAGISQLSRMNRSMIVPYLDLEGLAAGTYTLEVRFELPEGMTKENFISNVPMVKVTIY